MPTIDALEIITKAGKLLFDVTGVRWPKDELLIWLNDSQRQIVSFKGDAYVLNLTITATAGTKQTLPDNGISLVDVERNNGAVDGSAPGTAITKTDRYTLDTESPGWHSGAPVADAVHFTFDSRNPKCFNLFPAVLGTSFIDIVMLASPPAIADYVAGTKITLDDVYANAMLDYTLYRAFSKDSKNQDLSKAGIYNSAFMADLGLKEQAEKKTEPKALDSSR
ncbi:MAG: hypothetical protein OEX07_10860 [Gammaproteobacteria bacterium]|nr:hypothetical protein [Gammaproteobacteria bacterium]